MSTVTQFTTAPVDDSSIGYDRLTKDYAVYVGGELIAYAANYAEAEAIRTAALAARSGSVWSGR
jgi:hypothetical protein